MKEQTLENIKRVVKVLKKERGWIHIREIARRAELGVGSIPYYLYRYPHFFHIDEKRKEGEQKTILRELRWKR